MLSAGFVVTPDQGQEGVEEGCRSREANKQGGRSHNNNNNNNNNNNKDCLADDADDEDGERVNRKPDTHNVRFPKKWLADIFVCRGVQLHVRFLEVGQRDVKLSRFCDFLVSC